MYLRSRRKSPAVQQPRSMGKSSSCASALVLVHSFGIEAIEDFAARLNIIAAIRPWSIGGGRLRATHQRNPTRT